MLDVHNCPPPPTPTPGMTDPMAVVRVGVLVVLVVVRVVVLVVVLVVLGTAAARGARAPRARRVCCSLNGLTSTRQTAEKRCAASGTMAVEVSVRYMSVGWACGRAARRGWDGGEVVDRGSGMGDVGIGEGVGWEERGFKPNGTATEHREGVARLAWNPYIYGGGHQGAQ
jgi:hypothetical protein